MSQNVLQNWQSSPEYQASASSISLRKFQEVSSLLLERPNLNSTHLFRADIISDSSNELRIVVDEKVAGITQAAAIPDIADFQIIRTVVRRLIPRKPQVDRPLDQSCFTCTKIQESTNQNSVLVVYVPHVASADDIPWYHPRVKALAYYYDISGGSSTISVHYQTFPEDESTVTDRLHRTMVALLRTFVRLTKLNTPEQPHQTVSGRPSTRAVTPAALRDTILSQHIVQDTYTRLKQTYASDLIARWVENTDPSKHVFEDLAIAAFLIELWKEMYGEDAFPGFVDVACGNGVLVYILIKEGFGGHGFDARKRKTWEVLQIDEFLEEKLCIPKPFLDCLETDDIRQTIGRLSIHDGIFPTGTFVISNHADELTPWIPILAAMSSSECHLPFIAIPCCSHALSGARHRYSLRDVDAGIDGTSLHDVTEHDEQSTTGDLKALRAQKVKALAHGDEKSAYACLTKKTVALAEELGFHVEMTLMRIPSTRNIGIVGNRQKQSTSQPSMAMERVSKLLERECGATGGFELSARAWIERALKHIEGQGRGKVNLRCNVVPSEVAERSSEQPTTSQ